jgi:hypothetical protein
MSKSPISIDYEDVQKGVSENLKLETNYGDLYGLPIDYEKELALLKLGYEGGQVIFTD